jgi:YggT family protein
VFNIGFSGGPLCALGNLYLLVLLARAVLSWFPMSPESPLVPIVRLLHTVTEPILAPFRRIIPPLGMFDMSYLVVFFVVEIFVNAVLCKIKI